MIKQLLDFLGFGLFAETALVLFFLIFVTIVIRTLLMRSDRTTHEAQIVLDDLERPQ